MHNFPDRLFTGPQLSKQLGINPSTIRSVLRRLIVRGILVQKGPGYKLKSKSVGQELIEKSAERVLHPGRVTPSPPPVSIHRRWISFRTPVVLQELMKRVDSGKAGIFGQEVQQRLKAPSLRDPAMQWTIRGDHVSVTVASSGRATAQLLDADWKAELLVLFPELRTEADKATPKQHVVMNRRDLTEYLYEVESCRITSDHSVHKADGDIEVEGSGDEARRLVGEIILHDRVADIAFKEKLETAITALIESNRSLEKATLALIDSVVSSRQPSIPGSENGGMFR